MSTARFAARLCLFLMLLSSSLGAEQWPSFRGPNASGVADGDNPPLSWNAEEGKNILWRASIPGLGHSSPVIWGQRVYLTTAGNPEHEAYLRPGLYGESPDNPEDWVHDFKVYCLDAKTGKILWERTAARSKPQVRRHIKSSHATPTIATDGQLLVASFGSEGLFAFDLEGELLWKVDLGYLDSGAFDAPTIQWGYGSSPTIYGDKVIVLADVNNQSFLAAFSTRDGKELWRTLRDEVPTWGTPTIHEGADGTQIIVNGFQHIGGYDVKTGAEIWRMKGGGDIPVPTPIIAHGLVFFTNAHGPQNPIIAVRLEAKGDISLEEGQRSNDFVAWSLPTRGAYLPTPIVYGDLLYLNNDRGILTVYEAKTGKEIYRVRVGIGRGAYTPSAVAADGRLYFTNEDCQTHVVKAGPSYELLASNSVDGVCLASPAISDGVLYVRTSSHLWALAETDKKLVFGAGAETTTDESAVQKPEVAESLSEDVSDPVAILKAADAATRALTGARYETSVEASGAAKGRYPDLEARVVATGWVQGLPEKFQVEGKVTALGPDGKERVSSFTGGSDGNVYYVLDHDAKTVVQDLETRALGPFRRALFGALVMELQHPEPFSQEITSHSHEFRGIKEIDGEPCYEVHVVYDEEATYKATWFFSRNDLLPRARIDAFPMQDGEKGGIKRTIRNLEVDPDLENDFFLIKTPAGYQEMD